MARLYAAGSRLHFTLLPFRSVGTKSGLLLAVRSDYIALHRRRIPRTLIALSVGPLSDGGGYCALWGGTERGREHEKLLLQLRIWLLRIARPDKIMYIGGSDTLPQPLSRTEEAQLIAQMDQGDFSVRQTLIERNLRLVVYLARRFENTGVNMEDLISIGTIGLIKAINTFRADKNIKLATYASRCIENEILMFLRKTPPSGRKSALTSP